MTEHDKYNPFAPDVCQGPGGRHYLVTCIWVFGYVSVAVSVSPAGPFSHLGIVAHSDGFILYGGVRFDPVVLCEDGHAYLYCGFCPDKHYPDIGPNVNEEAYMVELAPDMLTALTEPVCMAIGWGQKTAPPTRGIPSSRPLPSASSETGATSCIRASRATSHHRLSRTC